MRKKTGGIQVRVANLPGINRNTLRKKIREPENKGPFGLDDDPPEQFTSSSRRSYPLAVTFLTF